MRRVWSSVATFGIVMGVAASGAAQTPPAGGQQQPPPLTNLQVYPKDIPRPQLIATMQGFVAALGVQQSGGCGYCHAGTAPQFEWASDTNPKKNVARKMILMSREITAKLPEVTGKPANEVTSLRCATCHRGVAIPKLLPDVLTDTATKSGTQAAVQQYRDLRTKYYGGQSYDFSENGLVAMATPLIAANKPDDAIVWLQLNTEFYPKSSATYAALGQAYARKNDTPNAVKNFEKAVELDPNNQNAKRQLEQLKK
ncbi:MAG TPA: c-type cytochrome [Vicinamibacterales bacterium]|nr:c-type cytochrome [Vicinamibacterales bacterium]